jgi:hypothetical protein
MFKKAPGLEYRVLHSESDELHVVISTVVDALGSERSWVLVTE